MIYIHVCLDFHYIVQVVKKRCPVVRQAILVSENKADPKALLSQFSTQYLVYTSSCNVCLQSECGSTQQCYPKILFS